MDIKKQSKVNKQREIYQLTTKRTTQSKLMALEYMRRRSRKDILVVQQKVPPEKKKTRDKITTQWSWSAETWSGEL